MNQILITKKLYVTPELKRKKKIYKIDFIVSVFLVIALIAFYVYASFDRSKDEEIAKDLLANIGTDSQTQDDAEVEELKDTEERNIEEQPEDKATARGANNKKSKVVYSQDGTAYTSLATVTIPSIGVKYPVLMPEAQTTEAIEKLLKVSICKFWGPDANEVGNFCIVGHNYRNTKFFSKVPTLNNGDIVELTDVTGRKISYSVYDKFTVAPEDVTCTSQVTNGRRELTLITCTDDSSQRWIVKTREIK